MGKKGLTLIELLVTIAVLAVVAAIAVPVVGNVINNANEQAVAQTETDIANFTEKYSKSGGYTYDPSTGTFAGYTDLNGDGAATEDEKIEELNVDLDKFSVGSVGADVPTSAAEIDFDNPISTNFSIIDYAVTISPESLTINGWVNNAISATSASLDGAQGTITWTISEGTLPTGLSINPSTGIVTGTPTETYTLDTVVIQATDENGAAVTQSHSYDIAPEPTLTPASVTTEGLVGESLSTANASLNGFTEPYTWEITSGSLPTGLNLNSSTGTISGTPTEVGTSGLTIMLTDANSLTANQTHEFTIEASDLYEFTSATFTPGGQTGATGPSLSQIRNGLTGTGVNSWKNNTSYLNASSGIIEWTVPADGTYRIEAAGAEGGRGSGGIGGAGSALRGDFSLEQGDVLKLIVVQQGIQSSMGGGGGGTFVVNSPYDTNQSILIASGGGGGSSRDRPGINATITTFGSIDQNSGPAADNGNGGISFSGNSGGGGGGFFGNGERGVNARDEGKSFVNGGRGAFSTSDGTPSGTSGVVGDGGFGGGGGMYWNRGSITGPGGGGYSGGNGGNRSGARSSGGGGGSLNNGTNQNNQAGNNRDDGFVTIEKL